MDSNTTVGNASLQQLLDVFIARLLRERPCANMQHDETCVVRESKRPLEQSEHADRGWTKRPFFAYRMKNMCAACVTHWYAAMSRRWLATHVAQQAHAALKPDSTKS